MTVDQQFNILNDKLQKLLKQYSRLQKENDRLKDELQKARDTEIDMQNRVEAMNQQVAVLKLGNGALNDKDKKDFEKKISQYIREIDKCISFLSQ